MLTKMYFMVLELWQFGFGKILEIPVKEFVRTCSEPLNVPSDL